LKIFSVERKEKRGRTGRAPVAAPETQDAFPARLAFLWFFLSAMRKKEHFKLK